MSVVQKHTPKSPIDFTDAAAAKVLELIREENNPKLKLRVFITGGGCSGFQYGFTFDEEQNADDMAIQKELEDEGGESGGVGSVTLLVDPMSFQYLMGATIDYKEDLSGSQFVIKNPNAKSTCGCGQSFSI